ncbi:MAG: hypothetical protein K6D03_12215 [Solobacterium sp.]|nr:hypothetical protein [Solobacterium sp.]
MKKINILFASALILLSAGCKDAKAGIKDGKTEIMKVGSTSITKGDLYRQMFAASGADTALANSSNAIAALEIERTAEIEEEAESSLSFYKMYYGDQFDSYLKSAGISEEEYKEQMIQSIMGSKLTGKYVGDEYETVCGSYNPIQATVLEFPAEEDADAALSKLKDGTATAAEISQEYVLTQSGSPEIITINTLSYDASALSLIRSSSKDDGWQKIASSAGDKWYLVQVNETDINAFKDEAVKTISGYSEVINDATSYFYKKYNFHVYDIDLLNAVREKEPLALNQ